MILSTRRRAELGLAAAFLVLAASITTLLAVPRLSQPVAVADVGTFAPDFQLPDTTGVTFSLADCRGHVVVLLFSSLQSTLDAKYDESVRNIARNYDADGRVKFVAVNVGNGVANGATLDMPLPRFDNGLADYNVQTVLDSRAAVASRYSATSTPMVVVIDARGVVCYRGPVNNKTAHVASASPSFLADALHEVIGETRVAVASK